MRNEAVLERIHLASFVAARLALALVDFADDVFQTRATARVAPIAMLVASVPAARLIGACERTPKFFKKSKTKPFFDHEFILPCA